MLTVFCGPCVIESRENIFKIAKELEFLSNDSEISFYFKASYDKANRTSIDSFRGLGIKKGLEILSSVKKEFGYRLITDVHEPFQVDMIKDIVDVIQIPAFLCRQTDLLVKSAQSDCIVNIKKGQFLSPNEIKHPILKVLNTRGCNEATYANSKANRVMVTERGNSFGYGNLVVDMRSLAIMREFAPVVFDATHSVQMPGAVDGKTSGKREFVPYLARAAAAVGVDGFFFETHFDTKKALSDADNMIELETLKDLIVDIKKIDQIAKKEK